MTLIEILPTIQNLNRREKIYLLQIIVNELANDEKNLITANEEYPIYSPLNAFSGKGQKYREKLNIKSPLNFE